MVQWNLFRRFGQDSSFRHNVTINVVIATVFFVLGLIANPFVPIIIDFFKPKPEVILIKDFTSVFHNYINGSGLAHQVSFINDDYWGEYLIFHHFDPIPKKSLVIAPAIRFETDCEDCYYYHFQIMNTGEVLIDGLLIQGFTLEKPNIKATHNVKYEINEDKLFGKWGFNLVIEKFPIGQIEHVVLRLDKPYTIDLKCFYNNNKQCIIVNSNTFVSKKPPIQKMELNGKKLDFSRTIENGIYMLNKNTWDFVKIADVNKFTDK